MTDQEMSLGETAIPEAKPVDKTLDATTFNLSSWIAGATPTEHTVRLVQRGDLVGQIDALTIQINVAEAKNEPDTVEKLKAQRRKIAELIEDTSLDVVVQGRSAQFVESFKEELTEKGITEHEDQMKHLVVEQISQPVGFTVEFLEQLIEVMEPQITQLIRTVQVANSVAPKVTIPFS